eukprot:6935988-Prorocentrum_lima.AAC.1
MTSSLVGSEMCIRDRLRPAGCGTRIWFGGLRWRRQCASCPPTLQESAGTCLLYTSDAADDM